MQAFSSNSSHDYGIFVTVEQKAFSDDESLPIPIPIPEVSILLNVVVSYNVNSDISLPTTRAYDARLELDQPFHSFKSNSRDILSNMIDAMHIPFPLDRLRWKTQRFGGGNTEPLESVEAMVSRMALEASTMVENHGAAGLNKKLGILVTVEKEIPMLAHQLFDEMQQLEVEDRELRDEVNAQIETYHAPLALSSGAIEQIGEGWAQRLREGWHSLAFRASVMLSADDVHQMEDVLDKLLSLRDSMIRTCANMRSFLDTLAQNTGDIDDGALTEAAVRESLEEAVFSPMPATRASVEALEKFVFDGGVQCGSSSDQRCVVCLGKMLSGDQVTCLPCSHMFHGHCIEQWLRYGHVCPLCRFKLPTDY
ncbi:unnamed protein product [Prunus armeniaca]|uniref:RING-type domain-containing protein n=1 Tax=Prunus armeniaca TaxID=36596 RepID=A0A6J5X894_PRUAR|nr:unnamed protein product [Prunus armeniaca]